MRADCFSRMVPLALLCLGGVVQADTMTTVVATEPTVDRWNYGNNVTGGYRGKASLFTGLPADAGNGADRLAQVLLGFDTEALGIPAGLDPAHYLVGNVRLTVRIANDPDFGDPVILYDPTADPFDAQLPGGSDPDPGQPLELHGAGFRNGVTALSYQEGAPPPGLGQPGEPGTPYSGPDGRTAYALGFDEAGMPRDVSNNPSEGFDSIPWALGINESLVAGDPIPLGTTLEFVLDLGLPGVRSYVQDGLAGGRLYFSLSSMQPTVQSGEGGAGAFALIFMKESLEHEFFLDSAATLALDYRIDAGEEIPITVTFDRTTEAVVLSWPGRSGEAYQVWQGDDLEEFSLAGEVAAAQDGLLEYAVPVEGSDRQFFFVRRSR